MHIVYCHINRVNGKRYVGYTPKQSPVLPKPIDEMSPDDVTAFATALMHARWELHLSEVKKGSKLAFHRAIRKYGVDQWEHQIIEVVNNKKKACEREIHWIAQLDTFGSNGYNMTPGGEGITDLTPEDRERHRQLTSVGTKTAYAREDVKQRHLEAVNRPETRKRNSEAQKVAQNRPEVKQNNVEKQKLAALRPETHAKRSKVQHEIQARPSIKEKKSHDHSKPVQQVNDEGTVIATFSSATAAAKALGVTRAAISNCSRGLYPKVRGFFWRYV